MTGEKDAPAEMPSVEEIKDRLLRFHADTASAWRHERDGIATSAARAILDLFAPILAEKERDSLRRETRALAQAQDWRNEAAKAEARALAAEAARDAFKLALIAEKERADMATRQMIKQNNRLAALAQIAAPGAAMEAL